MSDTTPLSPILHRAPLVDRQTLLISRPWSQWLEALYIRAGGVSAPSNATLAESGAGNAEAIEALDTRLDAAEDAIGGLDTRVDAAEGAIVTLQVTTQPLDATLTSLAGLTTAPDTLPYFTGVDTAATTPLTPFARTLLDDTDAAAWRSTLGLGTMAVQNATAVAITGGTATGLGNSALGGATFGTSASNVLALVSGTAPMTSPADTVQLWEADRGGVAGRGSLHLRTEEGTSHVFGDFVGLGTLTPTVALQVERDVAIGDQIVVSVSNTNASGGTLLRALRQSTVRAAGLSCNDEWYAGLLRRGGGVTTNFAISSVLDTATGGRQLVLSPAGQVGLSSLLTASLGSGASFQTLTVKGSTLMVGDSTSQERAQALITPAWVVSTDASRTARLTLSVYDATAAREGLRVETSGTAAMLGFYGGGAVAKPTITGSRGGNAALASLLTALASLGLVTDSSTA